MIGGDKELVISWVTLRDEEILMQPKRVSLGKSID